MLTLLRIESRMLRANPARPFHDTLSSLYGDIIAGIVVAILSLPMTIPLGVLALAPLGPDYRTAGVIAGFHASIFAGFISALSGGSVLQISGPRASVSFIMATAISMALADPHLLAIGLPREEAALGIGFVVVFLAGLVQVVLGLMKLGRGIKFVPYPVLSGFKNGVGILIVSSGRYLPRWGSPQLSIGTPCGRPFRAPRSAPWSSHWSPAW